MFVLLDNTRRSSRASGLIEDDQEEELKLEVSCTRMDANGRLDCTEGMHGGHHPLKLTHLFTPD